MVKSKKDIFDYKSSIGESLHPVSWAAFISATMDIPPYLDKIKTYEKEQVDICINLENF